MDLKNFLDSSAISNIVKDVLKEINSDIYSEFSKLNDRLDKIEATLLELENTKKSMASDNSANTKEEKTSHRTRRNKVTKICSIEGCEKPAKCKGLCLYHYQCFRKKIRAEEQQLKDSTSAEALAAAEARKQEIQESIKPIIRKKKDDNEAQDTAMLSTTVENNQEIKAEEPADESLIHPALRPII